ncbi:TlpA family protein disulfide reductase [Lysinibacillus sp. 54212]|uniref:TlpA family protein disulfide reductase n=1 Tax=Lysinibacillus sp. 54212 TaxID=3119829 RepID=UPI002FC6EE88
MDYLSIGSISVPIAWIAFFVAAFVSDWRSKQLDPNTKKVLDSLLWIYIALWKGSYIVFFWEMFIESPLSLLYFDGGLKGHILALIVLCIHIWLRREHVSIVDLWSVWLKFIAVYQMIFAGFTEQWLLASLWVGFFILLKWKKYSLLWMVGWLLLLWQYTWSASIVIAFSLFFVVFILNKSNEQRKQFIAFALIIGLIGFSMNDFRLKQKIEAQEYIDIALETTAGEVYDLKQQSNDFTVVNFFATWCPPCNAEMPHLQAFANDLPQGVELIGVNLTARDNGQEALDEFLEKYEVTYPILMDRDDTVGKSYQVITIPTTVILDRDGNEVERIVGPVSQSSLEKLIEKY